MRSVDAILGRRRLGLHGARPLFSPLSSSALGSPVLSLDFKNGRYTQKRTRTNYIRNSTMQGAIPGTPGTLPTNWLATGLVTGLSGQVIGTGQMNGYTYLDWRIFGTNNSGASATFVMYLDGFTSAAAASGQTWTTSYYIGLVGGSTTNISSLRIGVAEMNSSGTFLNDSSQILSNIGPIPFKAFITRTFNNASTAFASAELCGTVANGASIDATFRFYAPQLEQAPGPSAFIPTTNGTVSVTDQISINSSTQPQRMNLLNWSNDYTQSQWGKVNTTVDYTQAVATPTGEPLAYLTETAAGGSGIYQYANFWFGKITATYSVVLKRATHDWVIVILADYQEADEAQCWVNLATGALGTVKTTGSNGNVSNASAAITNLGQGCYRVSVTATIDTNIRGNASIACHVSMANGDNTTGVGTGSRYQGLSQLELGQVATPYIGPTDASGNGTVCCKDGVAGLYGYVYNRAGVKGEINNNTPLTLGPKILSDGNYLGSTVDNGNGTYTIPDGVSTAPRFTFPLASLRNGALYQISFTVISNTKSSVGSDFCDVTPGPIFTTTPGLKTYTSTRTVYDSTYRFVDIDVSAAGACTFTKPFIQEVLQNNITYAVPGFPDIVAPPIPDFVNAPMDAGTFANLLLYSQQLDNGAWGKSAVSVAPDVAVAPDGTTTADKLVSSTANGGHLLTQSVTAGATNTVSFFAKAGEYGYVRVIEAGHYYWYATINLLTGAVTNTGGANFVSAMATPIGGGWYRCVVINNNTATNAICLCPLPGDIAVNSPGSYTGDGTSGVYIWQVQNVVGSIAGPVVPTTNTSATRFIAPSGYWARASLTNLFQYSQQFDQAVWNKNVGGSIASSVSSNAIVAPDGSLSGDLLTEDTTTNIQHGVVQGLASGITSGTAYTISVFAKQGPGSRVLQIYPQISVGGNCCATYSLNGSGSVVTVAGTGSGSATISSVGNGWYRCVFTFVAQTSGTGNFYIVMQPSTAATINMGYNGDGTSGIYLWQGQMVQGSDPGPIIVTTSSTANVGNDDEKFILPNMTDQDFVIYAVCNIQPGALGNGTFFATFSDGAVDTNSIKLVMQSNNYLSYFIYSGGTSVASGGAVLTTPGRAVIGVRRKAGAWGYGCKTPAGSVTLPATATIAAFPNKLFRLDIASQGGGTQPNSPIEFVGIALGTFSDAQFTALLQKA